MGAKFSSGGGATVFYDDGPITAPSGEQGTQRNEFEAAIKSVTSSTTVGAVFVYDTRNDSDGGAWRKKCAGLSWYDEDLNTATRGGRREFPSVALIVADNAAGSETITIYDLDDPAMPMWLVFQMGGANESLRNFSGRAGENANSLFALNGCVMWGINADLVSGGVCIADFANDAGRRHGTLAAYTEVGRVLSERNSAILPQRMVGGLIVNSTVNDVAATIVEGAEIGALGLPIPTVAVATGGGVSVIHSNGSVYDFKDSTATNRFYSDVRFRESGDIFAWSSMNGTAHSWYASQLYSDHSAASDLFKYDEGDNANLPNLLSDSTQTIAVGKGSVFTGGSNGLSIVKENLANPVEGASAHVTSSYNTGYMLGDIRLSTNPPTVSTWTYYSNGDAVQDRSVKANHLSATGQVDIGAVETNAELFAFSGFSTSNYLSKSYDADFDFGTGDVSFTFWAKYTPYSIGDPAVTQSQVFVDRSHSTAGTPRFLIYNTNGNILQFFIYDGTSSTNVNADDWSDGQWHQVVAVKNGTSNIKIYVDGVLRGTQSSSIPTGSFSNSNAQLYVGVSREQTSPLVNGSMSLLRISKTVPTPQQVKEMYEAEKPLFRAGAKCLLQSDSGVSPNGVEDLAFDDSTGLLHVAQRGNTVAESRFRGLEMVESVGHKSGVGSWDYSDISIVAANAGVVASARTLGDNRGVITDLPAIDVRGDINTADTKLPDDGKLHFSGVTTSNGGDVLGHIPIGENENVTVKAHVTAKGYGSNLGTHYANYVLTEQFYRAAGGDVTSAVAEASIVSQESAAGLDATLGVDTSADTAKITVTGDASDRIVWTASVEVIRDAEKSYER